MPEPARTSDLTILGVAGVVVVVLATLSFAIAPDVGQPRQAGSSYAADPGGAKAAYLLLEELGYRVERSLEPFAAITRDPTRTAIVLTDPLSQPSMRDVVALQTFVERGGTVLASGSLTGRFLPQLHAGASHPDAPVRWYRPAFPSPVSAGVPSLEMRPPVRGGISAGSVPVFGTFDEPAVLLFRAGAGRIIWLASSDPLSNEHIAKPGHAEFLLNALGAPADRTILWDEHYHGFARSFWSYMTGTPVAWSIAQLGVVAVLALLTFARRRGPVRATDGVPRTSPLEFIDTMAGLYQRSHAAAAAVATARARVRRLLAAKTGLPVSSDDDRFASALAQRPGLDVTAVAAALNDARRREAEAVTDAEALRTVRALHEIERTILAGPGMHLQEKR